jgi:hypothetical protein
MCMLRQAVPDAVESVESPIEDTVTLTERFEHYELVKDEHGNPIELSRGAMGITYKAFDVDLRCPVTLKVISEKYLDDFFVNNQWNWILRKMLELRNIRRQHG